MKKKLKEISTQVRGVSYKPSDVRDEFSGVPILRANNIQDTGIVFDELVYVDSSKVHSEQYLLTDDIVICASSGSKNLVGKAATYKSDLSASFGAFCKVVRINNSDDLCKAYIQQYFQSKIYRNAISESSAGANINNIKTEDIESLEIPLPSKEEQIKIAAELDTIQSAIDNKKQQLALLDEAVKSEFVEMFGENPVESGKWKVERLGNLCTITSGGTPDRKNEEYWKNGTIPWIKTTELQNNELSIVEEYITEKGLDESAAKIVPEETILLAMYGQGKTRGMTAFLKIQASTNQACACILPTESKELSQRFIWYFLIMNYENVRNLAVGCNQLNLNSSLVKNIEIPVPSLDLQNQFAAFVQQIDRAKSIAKQQIADLQELLDSKMQQYFA